VGVLSYNRREENTMSAARASLSVAVRRLSIAASIVGCIAGSATMHGQKKGFACDTDNGGLTLPTGFCAGVIADNLGTARNLVVAPNGDIFVSVRSGPECAGAAAATGIHPRPPGYGWRRQDRRAGEIRDARAQPAFRLRNGYLYYATPISIERFKLTPGQLKPSDPAEVIVGDFPSGANQRGHRDKDIAFDTAGNVYVNVGLPSNACAEPDRQKGRRVSIPVRSSKSTAASGSSAPIRPDRNSRKPTVMPPACGSRSRSTGTTAISTSR
jgi:glucose/arabinose dehydrogenase